MHGLPELAKACPRAVASVFGQSGSNGNGIDGAGAGAGNPSDVDLLVLKQAIKHTPRKCTVRSSTLQGEIEFPVTTKKSQTELPHFLIGPACPQASTLTQRVGTDYGRGATGSTTGKSSIWPMVARMP